MASQVVSFPHVSPYVLHAPPTSVFLIWSPEWYLVKSRVHQAPRVMQSPPHLCYLVLLRPTISSTLFSKTFSLVSSLNVSDQVSHPHKTTGKILVLYILVFTLLDSKLGRQKSLHRMITSIPWLHSALNFFVKRILGWRIKPKQNNGRRLMQIVQE